jgi:hypothetical protein
MIPMQEEVEHRVNTFSGINEGEDFNDAIGQKHQNSKPNADLFDPSHA